MSYPYPYGPIDPLPLISGAANVKDGTNPSFTSGDFYAIYPQFNGKLEDGVMNQFIAMANSVVLQVRWHEQWTFGMCLFIAHFATLYLQTMTGNNPDAKQVVAAAQARGLQTSKSVGSVSVSQDFNSIGQDLDGWAAWKLTQYGQQFATLARMLGKGGMYVW